MYLYKIPKNKTHTPKLAIGASAWGSTLLDTSAAVLPETCQGDLTVGPYLYLRMTCYIFAKVLCGAKKGQRCNTPEDAVPRLKLKCKTVTILPFFLPRKGGWELFQASGMVFPQIDSVLAEWYNHRI